MSREWPWRKIVRRYVDERGEKRVELKCGHTQPDGGDVADTRRCIHCYISKVRRPTP